MKIFSFLFDDKPSLAVKWSGMFEETESALDAEGRRWPRLSTVSRDRVSELESTITKLSAELILRCTQVADLYNIRQQQANELLIACDEIDSLSKSIDALHNTMTQREIEATTTGQKLIQLDKENITLRLELERALKESAKLLQRLLEVETAFNDREITIVSTQEKNSQLKAEMTTTRAESIRLAAAIEKENQRHCNELNQQSAHFKDQIRKIEGIAAERSMQVKDLEEARAKLANRCDDLTKTVDALKSARQNARKKIESQTVEVLETLLRIEKESAEIKITELTAELQRARLEHSAAERASAGIRENIVLLLPKLAALRSLPTSSELDTSISHNNAA
jgi:chromosome segregation ATPase